MKGKFIVTSVEQYEKLMNILKRDYNIKYNSESFHTFMLKGVPKQGNRINLFVRNTLLTWSTQEETYENSELLEINTDEFIKEHLKGDKMRAKFKVISEQQYGKLIDILKSDYKLYFSSNMSTTIITGLLKQGNRAYLLVRDKRLTWSDYKVTYENSELPEINTDEFIKEHLKDELLEYMVSVDRQKAPRKTHYSFGEAHKEAVRLASQSPDRTVRVLEVKEVLKSSLTIEKVY